MQIRIKLIAVLAFTVFALVVLVPSGKTQTQTSVETAGQKFKSIKVLNDMPADQMGKVMNMVSASLGVDCIFCHTSNDGDYEKEGVEHKDTARKMMKMVFDLNKTQFNGRLEINCNSCHNGKSHPQPSFPLTAAAPPEERPKQPEKKPAVDDIVAKYETALGGRANLAKVTSMQIKANRLEPDGKTTEPETIWIKANKYVADTIYGQYIVKDLFDGTAAKKFSNSEQIELKADETEQIKREAELFSPANLKLIFPKMDFRAVDRIDGREVNTITATAAGGVRERLSFDVVTGLLVRRSVLSPTVFGNFVYQVDYADYKPFGDIKLPTTVRYSMPHINWTRKILDVKINAPVDDALFAEPAAKK